MGTPTGTRSDMARQHVKVHSLEVNGQPITGTGADIVLTGMTTGTATPVAATDTVNEAIAKLQAQIDAL